MTMVVEKERKSKFVGLGKRHECQSSDRISLPAKTLATPPLEEIYPVLYLDAAIVKLF